VTEPLSNKRLKLPAPVPSKSGERTTYGVVAFRL
jgi:hypothetical protein